MLPRLDCQHLARSLPISPFEGAVRFAGTVSLVGIGARKSDV
jgi:hypothetical protein